MGELIREEEEEECEEGGGGEAEARQRRVGALIVKCGWEGATAKPWILIMGRTINPGWCISGRGEC